MTLRTIFVRSFIGVLAVAVLGTGIVGGFGLLLDRKFDTDAPLANFDAPQTLAEARLQDVEHLRHFFDLEQSFTPGGYANAQRLYARLADDASALSNAQFDLAVAEFVASAGNAHTKISEYQRLERYGRLPFRGHFFADGYFVVRAHETVAHLLGAEVLAIDGLPIADALEELNRYIAGPDGTVEKYAPYILEAPELMAAAGLSSETPTVRFRGADSEVFDFTFSDPLPPSSEQAARSFQLLSPDVYSVSQPQWRSALRDVETPPQHLRATRRFRVARLPEIGAIYLQYWTNDDPGDGAMQEMHREAMRLMEEMRPDVIVLDQRFNPGGDYTNTVNFLRRLVQRLPDDGRLYVLIGGSTFSAGIFATAHAVEEAGDRAVLVGAPVGDRLQHYGEDNLLVLPNSGIEIKFTTGFHDLTQRCRSFSNCFWLDVFWPVAVSDLDPDIYVPTTSEDYFSGRDPVLEAVIQLELAETDQLD